MKVIIARGRDFCEHGLMKDKLDTFLKNLDHVEIVSGGCSGADACGERYAAEKGYSKTVFMADWDTHGKAAGPIRNKQMAEYADALVAFWDGESRGTRNMIELAKAHNLKVRVVRY